MFKRMVAALGIAATMAATPLLAAGTASAAGPSASPKSVFLCELADEWCTTTKTNVNVRGHANTSSTIVGTVASGQAVYLHCWVYGETIGGDRVWYLGGTMYADPWRNVYGYMSAYYLATGTDPNRLVPEC